MELQLSNNILDVLAQIDVIAEEGGLDELIDNLSMADRLVGIAKAKALYLREKSWNNPDESFRDFAVHRYAIRAETIKRYIDVWEMILLTPEDLRIYYLRKPMETLIPLATNLANGEIEVEEVDWVEYVGTTNNREAYAVVDEMIGRESSVERVKLYIDMKTGDISSWQSENYEHIGYLDVDRMDLEQVKKGILRIINKAGIREKENA